MRVRVKFNMTKEIFPLKMENSEEKSWPDNFLKLMKVVLLIIFLRLLQYNSTIGILIQRFIVLTL